MILSSTASPCRACRASHPAHYEDDGGHVTFSVDCPAEKRRATVSSDSRLFAATRQKSRFRSASELPFPPRRLFYLIEITDACNLSCPVCYAEAGAGNTTFADLDQVRRRALQVKADGGKWITLTGGEPTVHPDLEKIVRLLNREMGLSALIITNGVQIAEDPALLPALKKAGLKKVQLQFDTFNDATSAIMRGAALVQQKLVAIERIRSAGLRLGLVTTVCDRNISEARRILEFAGTLTPSLNTVLFQSLVPRGRFPESVRTVDREQIVAALCGPSGEEALQPSDFLPPLQYVPWRVAPHPDCSVMALACAHHNGLVRGLGQDVRLDLLWERLQARNGRPGLFNSCLIPLAILAACARPGRLARVLRRFGSLVYGKGSDRLFLVTVGSYMTPETLDEGRLSLCTAGFVTDAGIRGVCERLNAGKEAPRDQ